MKLTGDPALDAERVRAVRKARPDTWLGVDANQGFDADSLEALMPALVACKVKLVEQPFARGREAELEGLRCPIPIAADESVQGLADIEPMVGRCDIINIKLDKCGGLTEGLAMAAEARRLGLGVMVGNMVGTSLAMAPAWLLGQLCDIADLDGTFFITRDRDPAMVFENGKVSYPARGWGAACDSGGRGFAKTLFGQPVVSPSSSSPRCGEVLLLWHPPPCLPDPLGPVAIRSRGPPG